MSLSFKTVNLFSSTYCTVTQEQIQQILSPVSIVLVEEQVVEPQSTGPQMESTGSNSEPLGVVVTPPDSIPYNIPNNNEDDADIRKMTEIIIEDFVTGAYGSDGTTDGQDGSSSGIASPRGKLIRDRLNPEGEPSNGDVPI